MAAELSSHSVPIACWIFSSAGITVGSLLGILIARWRCYANCKNPELRGIPKYTNETSGDINTNHHLLSNIEPLIAAPQ